MLNAIALFAFALENSLFLLFPYQQRSEGISMLIRAKLMLVGKSIIGLAGVALLGGWMNVAQSITSSWSNELVTVGVIAGAWAIALTALVMTTSCWKSFDITLDTPPR